MGKVSKYYYDRLIDPIPDRNGNRVRVYEMDNGEVVIHFRNLKINLLTEEERREWKEGFTEALKNLREGNYFENDL